MEAVDQPRMFVPAALFWSSGKDATILAWVGPELLARPSDGTWGQETFAPLTRHLPGPTAEHHGLGGLLGWCGFSVRSLRHFRSRLRGVSGAGELDLSCPVLSYGARAGRHVPPFEGNTRGVSGRTLFSLWPFL